MLQRVKLDEGKWRSECELTCRWQFYADADALQTLCRRFKPLIESTALASEDALAGWIEDYCIVGDGKFEAVGLLFAS